MRRRSLYVLLTLAIASCCRADAMDAVLDTITVVASGVSNMNAASAGDVGRDQIQSEPLLRPAAILENVPGLIVTQHSGEGKANQYFLRAFNLDHGTDFAIQVDDMPVNLPSHAHGQGYADLNFLIPETVGDLHYKKGPYYADEGDFATAGTSRIDLANDLPGGAALGFGQDGYRRALVLGSARLGAGALLAAGEAYHNDGPFEVPDDYRRLNGLLRYVSGEPDDYASLTAMAYSGRWNATDQVPLRAMRVGLIGRFGSLGPSDGGDSDRFSLSFNRIVKDAYHLAQLSAYVIRYRLDLFSDFTYFLDDPVNGDQFRQHDDRWVYGFKGSYGVQAQWLGRPMITLFGLQGRVDDIGDASVTHTRQRQFLSSVQDAALTESSVAAYVESSIAWSSRVRTTLGLRGDLFDFDVRDRLTDDPQGSATGKRRAQILSPKLGLTFGPWRGTSLYVNAGDGYHSNDARGITRRVGSPEVAPVTPLTRAASVEIGMRTHPLAGWESTLDVFKLKLRSELVFDGDAGTTEPSGATSRTGIEWGNQVAFNDWLSMRANAAFTRARFDADVPGGGRNVPNSPTRVLDVAVRTHPHGGWFGELRLRAFGPAPLIESGGARAPGYVTVDAQFGYALTEHWSASLDVFNLANRRFSDIEYFYVSRLKGESAPHADYVVHPGVPRTLRAAVRYAF